MKREWQQQNALTWYNIKFSVCVTTHKMHHGSKPTLTGCSTTQRTLPLVDEFTLLKLKSYKTNSRIETWKVANFLLEHTVNVCFSSYGCILQNGPWNKVCLFFPCFCFKMERSSAVPNTLIHQAQQRQKEICINFIYAAGQLKAFPVTI